MHVANHSKSRFGSLSKRSASRRNRRLLFEQFEDRRMLTYEISGGVGANARENEPQVYQYITISRANLTGPNPNWPDSVTVRYALSGTATPLKDYTLPPQGSCTIPAY